MSYLKSDYILTLEVLFYTSYSLDNRVPLKQKTFLISQTLNLKISNAFKTFHTLVTINFL